MRDFHHRGSIIRLQGVAGQVLSTSRSATTEYQLSGGGGYVPSQGGYVTAPKLHSTTTERQELWLGLENGVHRYFDLTGTTVELLAGQNVVMVLGATGETIKDMPVGLLNASADMWHPLPGSYGLLHIIDDPLKMLSFWMVSIALIVTFITSWFMLGMSDRGDAMKTAGYAAFLGAPIAGIVYWYTTFLIFGSRVHRAHESLQQQARKDSWLCVATPAKRECRAHES